METATLTHNFFFSYPYHTVLPSRPHLSLLLLGQGLLNWRPAVGRSVGHFPCGVPSRLLAFQWPQAKTDTRHKAHTETAYILCGHLHISFHNTCSFLLNHVTASDYFHWCIQCRESLTARSWVDIQQEDKQLQLAWQLVNEVSRRKISSRAKVKTASKEERRQKWKEHAWHPSKVSDKPIKKKSLIAN